jgi:ribonuclease P protein component
MTVHWLRGDNPARLGLAVSRKVDTRAVGRNRIKRVLRNATRHLLTQMSSGDFVVVARAAAREASNEQIQQAFLRLLRRAGALPPMGPEVTMTSPGSVNPFPLNGPESASGRVEPAC